MTINDTNITTAFGLRIIKVEGLYDLPQRKRTLTYVGVEAKDIVFDAKKVTFTLYGCYADATDMLMACNAFATLLKTDLKHRVIEPNRGIDLWMTAADGFETTAYLRHKAVKITLPLTIAQHVED